jgi:hypothetical protein
VTAPCQHGGAQPGPMAVATGGGGFAAGNMYAQ